MGRVLQAGSWCRDRSCRGGARAEHFPGDGCSCHGRADEVPEAEAPSVASEARLTRLTARAARLSAFACRVCRRQARVMVEYPDLFFRCEPCAGAAAQR
jgi:hypothetical protein